jgi:hypothetical protein
MMDFTSDGTLGPRDRYKPVTGLTSSRCGKELVILVARARPGGWIPFAEADLHQTNAEQIFIAKVLAL